MHVKVRSDDVSSPANEIGIYMILIPVLCYLIQLTIKICSYPTRNNCTDYLFWINEHSISHKFIVYGASTNPSLASWLLKCPYLYLGFKDVMIKDIVVNILHLTSTGYWTHNSNHLLEF